MDLLEYIKIAALIALAMFIIMSIFAMTSFKSIIRIVDDAVQSLNKFKKDVDKNMSGITDNISELKDKVIVSLENFDNTAKKLAANSDDITELKDKVVDTLSNVDTLTGSLVKNSQDISELKTKVDGSLENINNLANQVTDTAKNIESNANTVLDSIKPVTGMVKSVSDKITPPISFTASLISASSKAVKTFVNSVARKDIKKNYSDTNDEAAHETGLKTESEEISVEPIEFEGSSALYDISSRLSADDEKSVSPLNYDDSSRASDSFIVFSEEDTETEKKQAVGIMDSANEELDTILSNAENELQNDDSMSEEEKEEMKKKINSLREDAKLSAESLRNSSIK